MLGGPSNARWCLSISGKVAKVCLGQLDQSPVALELGPESGSAPWCQMALLLGYITQACLGALPWTTSH